MESKHAYSKYVGDYLRHKIVSTAKLRFFGIDSNLVNRWEAPVKRKKYCLWDINFSKELGRWRIFLSGENIFNQDYYELADIKGPKRWYRIGFECSW